MAESTTTPTTEETTQTGSADQSGQQATEPKTFTQEQVNRMIQERIARVKSEPPADYDELKAKAAKYDELAEANKSDLEKANDAATKAKAKADEWQAKYEALQAEQERQRTVAEMAAQYGVDQGTLSRMGGDVEENAKYLATIEAAKPKYPAIADDGGRSTSPQTLEDALKGAKTFQERIWARAEFEKNHK